MELEVGNEQRNELEELDELGSNCRAIEHLWVDIFKKYIFSANQSRQIGKLSSSRPKAATRFQNIVKLNRKKKEASNRETTRKLQVHYLLDAYQNWHNADNLCPYPYLQFTTYIHLCIMTGTS
jgi:hypothetical protein